MCSSAGHRLHHLESLQRKQTPQAPPLPPTALVMEVVVAPVVAQVPAQEMLVIKHQCHPWCSLGMVLPPLPVRLRHVPLGT